MLGQSRIRVYRRPLIAILSSGNELVPAGRSLRPGAIRDTNSVTLAGLATASQDVMSCNLVLPGIPIASDREPGSEPATKKRADLIVTSAGVSVGALDLVRDVVQAHGRLIFWRVNVRPGKPLAVGERTGAFPSLACRGIRSPRLWALSSSCGRPSSASAGERWGMRRKIRARLTEPITSDGRESYLRATVEEAQGAHTVRLTGHQGSGNLLSLVQANALLVVPAGVKSLAAGDQVEAWLL